MHCLLATASRLPGLLRLLVPAVLAAAASSAAAATCEELRAEIEAKIRTAGVARFSVTVADAAAAIAPGTRVVGSCDRGARRILYLQEATTSGDASAAAPARRRSRGSEPMLTECRDGSASMGGDCRP